MSSETPSRRRPLLAFAILLIASAGCGLLTAERAKLAPEGPAFSHKKHMRLGLECADCHEDAEDEPEAGMPDREICWECHEDIDDDEKKPREQKIAAWEKKPGGPLVWNLQAAQSDEIRFDHGAHADADISCTACHDDVIKSERVPASDPMSMTTCMQCHSQTKASNACQTCHTEIDEDWRPPNHERLWDQIHGQLVRNGNPESHVENCSLCHTESSCTQCHRTTPPRDHSQSWRRGGGHGLASALDRERCAACHEVHSCDRCHQTARPRSHRSGFGSPRNAHCVTCHLPLRPADGQGCGVCHKSTRSHRSAPRQPSWHRPDMQCRQCHTPLPHPDNGQSCNSCHR